MQPDPKNTALKLSQLVSMADLWTKITIQKAATTGGFDFQFYKGKTLYNPGQKHKIHHPSKNHTKGGCTNHMGYFQAYIMGFVDKWTYIFGPRDFMVA